MGSFWYNKFVGRASKEGKMAAAAERRKWKIMLQSHVRKKKELLSKCKKKIKTYQYTVTR